MIFIWHGASIANNSGKSLSRLDPIVLKYRTKDDTIRPLMRYKRNKTTKPELSVVVMCYRSGKLAESFYKKLVRSLEKNSIDSFEVVLVGNYDSSDDITPEVVRNIAAQDQRVVAVIKRKKGMMGWDLRSGLNKSKGEYIAMIDGDDQFKPSSVLKVYNHMKKTGVDFVKTRRLRRDDGILRFVISKCFNLMFSLFFGQNQKIEDINSKPKIFRRSLLKQLHLVDNGWFADAEIMIEVIKSKATMSEVGVRFHKNKYRNSFVGLNAIIEVFTKLVRYKFYDLAREVGYVVNHRGNWVFRPKASQAA